MLDFVKKIKLIIIPFLLIGIGYLLLSTFLHWLLILELGLLKEGNPFVKFGFPACLPGIPLLIWLRKRTNTMEYRSKKGIENKSFVFLLIAWIVISVSSFISIEYLTVATGKLTKLDTIEHLAETEASKYYQINELYIDKGSIGIETTFDVGGRSNDNFNMHIYIAMPIFVRQENLSNQFCYGWYGKEYNKRIDNSLTPEEKEKSYQSFAEESQNSFDALDPYQFIYLERVSEGSEDESNFLSAVKTSTKFNTDYQTVLLPVSESFEERNGKTLYWLFGVFGLGIVILIVMLLFHDINTEKLHLLENNETEKDEDLETFIEFVKPRERYFITPILMYANILVFIIMVSYGMGFFDFSGEDLLLVGANHRPTTINGEWWRLLTSTFLHGGLMHLVFNMYGLMFIGSLLEPVLGKWKFLLAYLFTGILASVASLWWYEATISVGASGAIFGMYGLFLAFLLTKVYSEEFGQAFLISTLLFIGFNLLYGLTGGIDNAAHIGGLLAGILVGLLLKPFMKKIF